MPNVQIVVEGDISDVSSSLDSVNKKARDLGGSFQQVGSASGEAFGHTQKDIERAHDAVRLFNETLGLQLPRALQKVIASSTVAGAVLQGAFNVGVVAAFGKQIVDLLGRLDEVGHLFHTGNKGASTGAPAANRPDQQSCE